MIFFFFANRVIYFYNKFPYQIQNSNSVKNLKIKLDDLSELLWKPLDELLNRI